MAIQKQEPPKTEIVERNPTASERFAHAIERQFSSEIGSIHMTPYEKTLAQHLFIKIDAAMIDAEAKRKDASKPPIVWANVNMTKLALDAVNRVQLGVDALLPGSLYPIAYFNDKTKKYDLDLRVGYRGELLYKSSASVSPVRNVRVELVYATDNFTVYKAGLSSKLEGYDFEITQPFDRGELVGGFGYVEFEDAAQNILVILSKAEIDKYRNASVGKNSSFWADWYEQMAYKTIVHRTMDKIVLDPRKINTQALASVEAEDASHEGLPETPALDGEEALELPPEDASVENAPTPDDEPKKKPGEKEPF